MFHQTYPCHAVIYFIFNNKINDSNPNPFSLLALHQGSEAANVTGPGGVPVKGSRYAPNKRRFRRRFFPRSPNPEDPDKAATDQDPPSDADGQPESEAVRPATRRRGPRRPRQEAQEVRVQ